MAGSSGKVLSGKVAKYIGVADVREIDANAWKNIGVKGQDKVVWDASNKFQVPVADLNPGAIRYLDEDDQGFVIADADAKS